ncbi:sensor histidine kinase [Streptomyces sp. SID13031]|uniref:sensor histidine kinase n=1 Tax=Streptomyces sp. SID13031 TaxID=2706046 RepID=UPI0013C9E84A|nr:sensor histidine kinase [Streptomyces sp. SID13031]NEA31672.1 sensor histidine kinase [Streptomyces sp. SID13031]
MAASPWWYPRFKAHPLAYDYAIVLLLVTINLLQPGTKRDGTQIDLTLTGTILILIACLPLAFRRKAPLLVLAITTLATIGYAAYAQVKSPIGLALACATYTVVSQKGRQTRSAAVCILVVVMIATAVLFTDGDLLANLSVAIFVLFAAAIGEAVRYRRAYLHELEDRVRQAEHSREEEAERRVIEERLRIAHELHDVIAHHIALMNVQAGVASHLLREQPDEADRALALVREGGRTVLSELTVLLGVLRRSGVDSLPTAPTPSLQELSALIESSTAAGITIDWQPPVPTSLPDVLELTIYRILQESLTNVVKHAPGAVVRVRFEELRGSLTIEVTDDGGHPGTPYRDVGTAAAPLGSGHGLLGMRERVAAVGGDMAAGPLPHGGFRVRAVLPLETGATGDDPGTTGRRSEADQERVPSTGELGARSRGRC